MYLQQPLFADIAGILGVLGSLGGQGLFARFRNGGQLGGFSDGGRFRGRLFVRSDCLGGNGNGDDGQQYDDGSADDDEQLVPVGWRLHFWGGLSRHGASFGCGLERSGAQLASPSSAPLVEGYTTGAGVIVVTGLDAL